MIQEFINDICKILGLSAPSISYDTSQFPTSTTLAQCDPNGSVIFLRKYEEPNPDQLFAIAHELRHIWQIQNDKQLYFASYKPREMCSSVEEYNLQLAELDANAFAGAIMVEFFHLKPLFDGIPPSVKSEIYKKMESLIPELSESF